MVSFKYLILFIMLGAWGHAAPPPPKALPTLGEFLFGPEATTAPVPPEVWAIREANGAPPCGAVILEERADYTYRTNSFRLRIRIYNEAGKAAANLEPFDHVVKFLEGRTVYPDGRAVAISTVQDFARQTVQRANLKGERAVVIPPGLTSDCVVDLHWEEESTALYGMTFRRPILRPFPSRFLQVSVPRNFWMGSAVLDAKALHLETGDDGPRGAHWFRFRDLPALEEAPYSARGLEGWPQLFCYRPSPGVSDQIQDPLEYWGKVADYLFRPSFSNLTLGSAYRALLRDLQKDLPADPLQRTQLLLARIEKRIRNDAKLTYEERGEARKGDPPRSEADLNDIALCGHTSALGMHYLAFQVLRDSQVQPVLLFVVDRQQDSFRPSLKTIFQFDGLIMGVKTADGKGYGWFQVGNRFMPVGIIGGPYQGTRGLLVDPADWSARLHPVPVQPSSLNQLRYAYTLQLEEEVDTFKVRALFSGLPEYDERCDYLRWDPAEQGRRLKQAFEDRSKLLTVTRAEVLHATDPELNLTWEVAGTRAVEGLRTREVVPFPGLPAPVALPRSWPETRTRPIQMDDCRVLNATCRFRVPRGWKLAAPAGLKEANAWGSVDWTAVATPDPEGTRVDVAFKVDASRLVGPGKDHLAFRTFLGWVEKGLDMGLTLVKE